MTALSDLALDAIKTLGGRAPARRIAEHVADHLDADEYRQITWNGFVSQVRGGLRSLGANGLPSAIAVGGDYVQTELLTVEEYRTVIGSYVARADANLALAQRFAAECAEVHGVSIEVPVAEAVSS